MTDRVPGRKAGPEEGYAPGLLQPIARGAQRRAAGLGADWSFAGEDVWHCYEMTWLMPNGRPEVCPLRIRIPCDSPATVESKSLKLYLNGFAQTRCADRGDVLRTLARDLGKVCGVPVAVAPLAFDASAVFRDDTGGSCLDALDVGIDVQERNPALLAGAGPAVVERLYTHLFASVCPVTGQPDWASMFIDYSGPRIDPPSLLRYLVSYRRHGAFHETIVEQVFTDLLQRCKCERLTVHGCFLRRGGIDINPFRSTYEAVAPLLRLARQ